MHRKLPLKNTTLAVESGLCSNESTASAVYRACCCLHLIQGPDVQTILKAFSHVSAYPFLMAEGLQAQPSVPKSPARLPPCSYWQLKCECTGIKDTGQCGVPGNERSHNAKKATDLDPRPVSTSEVSNSQCYIG